MALEKLFKEGQGRNDRKVFRDRRRRPILVYESVVDFERLAKSGRALLDVGRRIRHHDAGGKEIASYILPSELTVLAREDPDALDGLELPIGTVVADEGTWLRLRPGLEEVGVNDRGEIILRDRAPADPADGPVSGAVQTSLRGAARRLVARLERAGHEADRKEAEGWLRLLGALEGKRATGCHFKSAGVDCEHRGTSAHLHRTVTTNFFDVRDIDMVRIASLLAFRFRKLRRKVPTISIISLTGLPRDGAGWTALQKRVKAQKKPAAPAGFPERLQDSRFYDPQSKAIVPASFIHFHRLNDVPDNLTVITVNADSHAEVRGRGVLGALGSVLALVDVISTRTAVGVLSERGTATAFTGPTGCGRSTAALFWADRNEKYRRAELRRRYEMEIRRTPDAGRLGEPGIQKELDRRMSQIGLVCQEDWVEIFKEGAGQWTYWPVERCLHARTDGFPGLEFVLQENHPLLENVLVDLGGSGRTGELGRVNHRYPKERIFYDPAWGHILHDRASRRITAHVLLERRGESDALARRVSSREAIDWLLEGRTPDGGFEPLCNTVSDFTVLLAQIGVVGPRLVEACESARQGDTAPLGGGDAALGEVIYDKLDATVKLWLDHCREVPTTIVNTAHGLELTQDVHWLLSEHQESFGDWKLVTVDAFKSFMKERYGVSYGSRGEWTHVSDEQRRAP